MHLYCIRIRRPGANLTAFGYPHVHSPLFLHKLARCEWLGASVGRAPVFDLDLPDL